MATRIVNRTDLVGVSSVAWMRAVTIQWRVSDTKPNTIMYPFFDGRRVDNLVNGGAQLRSDASGNLSGTLSIPPFTFNTGEREFKLQESPEYVRDAVAGSTLGSARAVFTTSAVRNTLRETQDTFVTNTFFREINVIAAPPPPPPPPVRFGGGGGGGGGGGRGDPLAQSFFTHGVSGGCFITSVEVFFQSKDNNIPVRMELRELVNGTPGEGLASPYSTVTLNPSQVNVSSTALVPTKFEFRMPVYLPENRDWCFVLLANSNTYHVWTSRLGEISKETGIRIFEQPFVGSMFKSENNSTWTAEQTEDIKFRINKAKFNIANPGTIAFSAKANPYLIRGENLSVTSGSAKITAKFEHQHGLRNSDYIHVVAQAGATYRGIPATNVSSSTNSDFAVTVLDDYTVEFFAKSAATSTGTLAASSIVNDVVVDNGGSGYPLNTTIAFSAPPSGTTAAADLVISNGSIVRVNVTNRGSGYLTAPTYTLSFSPAVPATLTVISESVFAVTTNNIAHGYNASISTAIVPDTAITSRLKTTSANYAIGSYVPVTVGQYEAVSEPGILVSDKNQTNYLPAQRPTEVNLLLSSTNENTSPVIAMNEQRKLQTYAYVINNFPSYDSSVSVTSLPGSGLANTVYYRTTDATEWVWSGTQWIATNSEFRATGGGAYSKYMTKQITLETISKGARVYVNAASMVQSSFDVYIRTSLSSSGTDHSTLRWQKMECDLERNLSKREDEFLDYTFYLDNINNFDVYDIKIVFLSSNKAIVPRLANYRVIILAS